VACALVASAYACVCPQLSWRAPPSTAVDILLYLDLATTNVFCVFIIKLTFNSVRNDYLLSYILTHITES
jgi:hypothetical protein